MLAKDLGSTSLVILLLFTVVLLLPLHKRLAGDRLLGSIKSSRRTDPRETYWLRKLLCLSGIPRYVTSGMVSDFK